MMMKKVLSLFLLLFFTAGLSMGWTATSKKSAPPKNVKSANVKKGKAPAKFMEKVSYAIGVDIGRKFSQQEIAIDMKWFAKGVEDMMAKRDPVMSEEDFMETMRTFSMEMQQKMQKKMSERTNEMKDNLKKGEAFLEANKKKAGVKVLPSGLQYKIIKEGAGPKPKKDDVVKVHYKGTLIDGKQFDSSYDRGEPAVFPVQGVIPGWTEALQLMKTGSVWELYIPSKLGYGERGAGADIGPNSTLIFRVELIGIEETQKGMMGQ